MAQAVRFDASADKYTRSASGLNTSTSITWCCWVKLAANRGTYSMALASDNGASNYVQLGTNSSGNGFFVLATSGGVNSGHTFAVGTWTFIAFVQNIAGSDYSYHAPAPATTTTEVFGSQVTGFFDANTFSIGNDGFGDWLDGSVAQVKVWTAALTKAELEAEMAVDRLVRTANIWSYYSFRNGPQTNDESGQGRTLTAGGTLTADTSGPPISAPSGLFVDNFNRADTTTVFFGGLGLNGGAYVDWDGDGWKIASNKAYRDTSSGSDYATFATTLGSPDHYVEADYDSATGGSYCVVNLRRPSAANVATGYLGFVDPGGGACHIAKSVAGSYSTISGGDFSAGAPYPTSGRIRLEALGTLLTLKINGATVGSVTDSTITTGNYAGMNGSANAIMDNFATGPLTVPAGPTIVLSPTRSTVTLT